METVSLGATICHLIHTPVIAWKSLHITELFGKPPGSCMEVVELSRNSCIHISSETMRALLVCRLDV
jgi:hypothetical protein